MRSVRVGVPAVVAGAVMVCLGAAAARAETVFHLTDNTGNLVGWDAAVADSVAGDVAITFNRSDNGTVFFNQSINYIRGSDPIVVDFTKTSPIAGNLALATESVLNSTGLAWNGYRFVLSAGTRPDGAALFHFSLTGNPAGLGDFSIDPFTTFAFANNSQDLVIGGGVVVDGTRWMPGSTGGTGLLVASVDPSVTHFTFKQIPIYEPVPAPVPIPASAVGGLLLMGILFAQQVRRHRSHSN